MKLSKLFLINSVFNALGGVILLLGVNHLDNWLKIEHQSDFIWHLLAVCSISLAALSFYAAKFKELASIRAAVVTFLIFNGLAALASIWAVADGVSQLVWANTAVHLAFFALFLYFGIIRSPSHR